MPSLRSLLLRGCLVLALLGLAACGGGSSGDDDPADQAKSVCNDLAAFIVDTRQIGDAPSQEEARKLIDRLRAIAADAKKAQQEDSTYFALSNAVDGLLRGLETANANLITASNEAITEQCREILNITVEAPAPTTTAPTTTAATEP